MWLYYSRLGPVAGVWYPRRNSLCYSLGGGDGWVGHSSSRDLFCNDYHGFSSNAVLYIFTNGFYRW